MDLDLTTLLSDGTGKWLVILLTLFLLFAGAYGDRLMRATNHGRDSVRDASGLESKLDALGDRLTENREGLEKRLDRTDTEIARIRGIASENGRINAANHQQLTTTSQQIGKLFEKVDRGDEERHRIAQEVHETREDLGQLTGRVVKLEDSMSGLPCRHGDKECL